MQGAAEATSIAGTNRAKTSQTAKAAPVETRASHDHMHARHQHIHRQRKGMNKSEKSDEKNLGRGGIFSI